MSTRRQDVSVCLGLLPLLAVAGCFDYGLGHGEDVEEIVSGAEWSSYGPGGPVLDSGFPSDGGQPCDHAVPQLEVGYDVACAFEDQSDSLVVVTEWSRTEFTELAQWSEILNAPTVGHLIDDDGDGTRSGEGDVPEIVVVTDDRDEENTHGVLRLLPGDGRDVAYVYEKFDLGDGSSAYPYRYSGTALGDIDADGEPEIVLIAEVVSGEMPNEPPLGDDTAVETGGPPTTDTGLWKSPVGRQPTEPDTCLVLAITPYGEIEWTGGREMALPCGGHAPVIADLDADGAPEVVVGPLMLDGESGDVHGVIGGSVGAYDAYPEIGYLPVVADLDGDGLQELLTGSSRYDHLGNKMCSVANHTDGFAAVADLDGDGDGEVVSVGDNVATVWHHDCTVGATWSLQGDGTGGPPTVGDFDGDGDPEIGVAGAERYAVYEADGTVLWAHGTTDSSSHATGSSVFDFNGDGRAEVLYADEIALFVFDGPTGRVLLEDPQHTSRTLHEYPVPVDVDGDGQTELVVVNGGGHYGTENGGVYVLGSGGADWQASRQVWNQHAFSVTNIADDLSVPRVPEANWPTYNTFRSGDLAEMRTGEAPDLQVAITGVCNLRCDQGEQVIFVSAANGGASATQGGELVRLYAEDVDGNRDLLYERELQVPLAPGAAAGPWRVVVDLALVPDRRVAAVVDEPDALDFGALRECDEDNNEAVVWDGLCPLE